MKIDASLMTSEPEKGGEIAAGLEAQGFAAAWSFEGPHDPFFPLVLASQSTTRIELGTSIAVAFARNPMICAHIGHDLQLMSKGRFILGLGTQIKPHIEKRFSQPWSRPAARMREFALALRAIWRCWNEDERLDFRGEFYTHTLMTPVFKPQKSPWGPPRLFLAGVGAKMVEVCGEVADGFFVHPFHSPEFLAAESLPALERGLAKAGRDRRDYEISVQTIVAMGQNDEQIATARTKAKGQLSFYGSTPAYKGVLEYHGFEDLQPKLNQMSKEGRWLEMIGEISDEVFDTLAVSGTPAQVADRLRKRNAFAERTTPMMYNETGDDDAPAELVRLLAD